MWNCQSPISVRSPEPTDSLATASIIVATQSPGSSAVAPSMAGVSMNGGSGMKLYVGAIEAGNLSYEPGEMVRYYTAQLNGFSVCKNVPLFIICFYSL